MGIVVSGTGSAALAERETRSRGQAHQEQERQPERTPPPLRVGADLRCPHCRCMADERSFIRLPGGLPEFVQQTTAVYRCPFCRRHFALAPTA